MIDATITLEQCQLAYEAGMAELALKLFIRASTQLYITLGEEATIKVLAKHLTEDCVDTLDEYKKLIESDSVEHAAYESVISSIFLI